MTRIRWTLAAIIVLCGAFVALSARTLTDWFWFVELGYPSTFLRPIMWKAGVGAAAFLLAFVFLAVNVLVVRGSAAQALSRHADRLPPGLSWKWVSRGFFAGALLLALLYGASMAAYWQEAAFAAHGVPFGTADPIFGRDLSFYLFTLPMLDVARSFAMGLFVLAALVCAGVYLASGSFQVQGLRLRLGRRARVHLSLLVAGIALLKAWEYTLDAYGILYSTRGVVYGATYVDVHATLPALRILTALSLLLAVCALINTVRPVTRWMLTGVAALVAASVAVGGIYPGIVQEYVVRPNEMELERPYIEYHTAFTRMAYKLDGIERFEFDPNLNPGPETVANDWVQNNVRLWDWRPLVDTYNQLQSLRPYYDFIEVDVDRYWIDGRYRQVMLSARELTSSRLQNRSWINLHQQYTHGYGVVVSPVNEVDERGLPRFFLSDVPPRGPTDLKVTRPEIYYGEQRSEYVIVKTRQPEFDYPDGERNATTFYEGEGGVPLGGFYRKLLFAVRLGTTKILFSNDITSESRVMLNRTISERVRLLAPFLRYDRDPYLVIADGRLFWMIDAYTTSDRFPYSAPREGSRLNYIRNSVKVVVDAYNGSVDFYIADPEPVVETLKRIYPGVFKPIDEMPDSLRSHVRYPEDFFRVQAEMLTRYHMRDPQVFYNQEDVWELPREIYEQSEIEMQPYYVITRLPGEERESFVLMQPFTPVGKGNMVGWLAAESDGENYGRLRLYTFGKQDVTFGPMQFEARVNQDTEISSQLTLWGQQGSRVIRGNLVILPVGDALLYTEPLLLQAEQGRIPELKRVIVGLGGSIVMRESFAAAMAELLGRALPPGGAASAPGAASAAGAPAGASSPGASGERGSGPGDSDADLVELVRRAGALFDAAQAHAAAGSWAEYGRALEELAGVLDALQAEVEGVP